MKSLKISCALIVLASIFLAPWTTSERIASMSGGPDYQHTRISPVFKQPAHREHRLVVKAEINVVALVSIWVGAAALYVVGSSLVKKSQ